MNIILLAPPAAGKGTQAEKLKNNYKLNHISTGDLLRNAASRSDEFGKKLKEMLTSGTLVSDDIVLEVFNNYIKDLDDINLLLDGFPRNINQAKKLDEILSNRNKKIDYVFLLNVPKEVLLDRITGRRICPSCGKIYNVNNELMKPKKENICDECGIELIHRSDDNKDTFEIRFKEYLQKTEPLVEYYKNKNVLFEIDSTVDVEKTFEQIKNIINN